MLFEIKSPILGFEHVKAMRLERIDDIFLRITNTEGSVPSFTLINPFALREYEFEIPTALELLLDLKNCKNILVANIMVLQKPLEDSTINFLAPLVFNFDNKTMAQVVLDSLEYPQYSIAEPFKNFCEAPKDESQNESLKESASESPKPQDS